MTPSGSAGRIAIIRCFCARNGALFAVQTESAMHPVPSTFFTSDTSIFLKHAKSQCDFLIAGVVSDEMLRMKKGVTPVVPLAERLEIVRNIRFVDDAVAEAVPDKLDVWRTLKFDVLFKGDDWRRFPAIRASRTYFRSLRSTFRPPA
jgi:cytidylyltransferase-like protein